jgi:hypothetical protein
MSGDSLHRMTIGCAILLAMPSVLLAQLQSVDEATALSKITGRPIFAMAGNKT